MGHGCRNVGCVLLAKGSSLVILEAQRWQRLAPNNEDRILPESESGEMAIYMHHPFDHFDVVMSVCLPLTALR